MELGSADTAGKMKVALLWIEKAAPGTAPGLHLIGTRQRLDSLGWQKPHVIADTSTQPENGIGRVKRLIGLQLRAIAAAGPNVCVVARWHPAALPALALQRLRRGRTILLVQGNVADMHQAYPFTRRIPLNRAVIRPSLSLGDIHVAPNQGILDWVTSEVGATIRKSFVLENGFDGDAVSDTQPLTTQELEEHNLQARGFALFVGKFARWQGISTLLTAIHSPDWPADLPLVFVGDGAEEERIREASMRSPSRVHLIGRVPPEKALAWTASAAISLAARASGPASDRGVSPYKVLEAAGLGTPVVATTVKGQADLVKQLESGILVDPDSPQELASAVGRLWRDKALWNTYAISGKRNSGKFSWRANSHVLGAAIGAACEFD